MVGVSRVRWSVGLLTVGAVVGCTPAAVPPPASLSPAATTTVTTTAGQPGASSSDPVDALRPENRPDGLAAETERDAVPLSVREPLDRFAYVTFHVQRVVLLQERKVQRDLQLTAAQIKLFSDLHERVREQQRQLESLDAAQLDRLMEQDVDPVVHEFRRLVDEQLTPQQARQLQAVLLQRQRGAITFLLPGVVDELGLTPAQRAVLYRTVDETRRSFAPSQLRNPLVVARLLARAATARSTAEAQLTPEQKARWQTLLGR